MTIPRLRPMSDTDRPEKIVVFWYDGRRFMFAPYMADYRGNDTDIGWCTEGEAGAIYADLLERIKPPAPNPVYWGDEVVSRLSENTYRYIGPCVKGTNSVWCEEISSGFSWSVLREALTHQGKPITKFCHGLRPNDDEV